MDFMITRTSGIGDDENPPCEKAVRKPYTRVDSRTVDSPDKLNHPHDRDTWYERGSNHRVINGWISRDFPDTAWFIELNTLEELVAFYHEHGSLVFHGSYSTPEIVEIEIYDDYRE